MAETLMKPAGMESRKWQVAGLVGVALLAAGAYANSLRNGFALDDVAIVQFSPTVLERDWLKLWSDNYWPARDGVPDVLYRPLTVWTYVANEALTPGAEWAFHLVNVALHAIVSVLVAVLALRVTARNGIGIVAGALFALHPMHTEAVSNVVGRAELLAAMWSLLALLVYLPAGDPLAGHEPRRWWHGLLVAACFFLAMLSKETPVAMVAVFGFIDLWRWSHWSKVQRPRFWRFFAGQAVRYYVPVLVAFAVYLAMRIEATGLMRDLNTMHPVINPLIAASPVERVFTPFLILAKYFKVFLWPVVLAADYSAPSIMPTANPLHPMVACGLLITLLGVVAVWRSWKKYPALALTVVLFALSYALVANFLRIGTIMGERLFYLPSAFVCMVAGMGVMWLWDRAAEMKGASVEAGEQMVRRAWTVRVTLLALVVSVCGALTWRTVVRNTDWYNNVALALSAARDNPDSAKGLYWAGNTLVGQAPEPWMQDFGADLLHRSANLYPTYGDPLMALAKYWALKGDSTRALVYLSRAARLRGGTRDVRAGLAAVKTDLQKIPLDKLNEGIDAEFAGVSDESSHALARGVALISHGRNADAEKTLAQAMDMDANFMEAACELALLRLDMHKTDEGVALLRRYVMAARYNPDTRCLLAQALLEQDPKKYPLAVDEAKMNLDKAMTLINDGSGWRIRELMAQVQKRREGKKAVGAQVSDAKDFRTF